MNKDLIIKKQQLIIAKLEEQFDLVYEWNDDLFEFANDDGENENAYNELEEEIALLKKELENREKGFYEK